MPVFIFALSLSLGILWPQTWASVGGLSPLLPYLVGLISLRFFWQWARIIALCSGGFALGLGYGLQTAEHQLQGQKKLAAMEGTALAVGEIIDIPESQNNLWRCDFLLQTWQGQTLQEPLRVRLTYAQPPQDLMQGQKWQLRLKLSPFHGYQNSAGFDYEHWAYVNQLSARAWVESDGHNQLLAEAISWRQQLRNRLAEALAHQDFAAFNMGLALGDRSWLTDEHWLVLRQTGTAHLMAISGLHIGLLALLGYFLVRRGVRWCLPCLRWQPDQVFGVAGAVAFAASYAYLSGMAVPAQRALIMVVVAGLWVLLRLPFRFLVVWSWALILVVLWQPRSLLMTGFYLSFAAVAWIGLLLHLMPSHWSAWKKTLVIQLGLLLGLTPLSLFFFDQSSSSAFFANLVAIPYVSWVLVPLILLMTLVSVFSLQWAAWGFGLIDTLWQPLDGVLQYFALWPLVETHLSLEILLLSLAFVALVFWQIKFGKRLWLLLILPLVFFWRWPEEYVGWGEFKAQLLDVGQGMSVMVHTQDHLLIYDLGPAYASGFNTGSAVVLPQLIARGEHADVTVISHSDIDHAGGLTGFVDEQYRLGELRSGQLDKIMQTYQTYQMPANACNHHQAWQWDGVDFRFLWPAEGFSSPKDNAYSCVLLVTSGDSGLLISGDLEAAEEKKLLLSLPQDLTPPRHLVMIAGHHGSASSTSAPWLAFWQPEAVLFSSGYRNAWKFPKPQVVARAQDYGQTLDTSCSGEISWLASPTGISPFTQMRLVKSRFYHHQLSKDPKCLGLHSGKNAP